MKNIFIHNNNQGFALITAIMMLFAATVMGLMVSNSSQIEILLSGAQQRYENNFNVTESGWIHGAYWLDGLTAVPDRINTSITDPTDTAYSLIRNYGNGASGVLNEGFSIATADGTVTDQNIPYWFRVHYESDSKVAGYTAGMFREYRYRITSTANGQQFIEVRTDKVFKTGY
ncbi:MAG: pilus assembly PilX N-terminal domain-containing protein [Deltaproteobacteria bacterium]|nr:pilus assembly PilX N-terminal domain-containing protein [Deltaproteobacteria bacterium]